MGYVLFHENREDHNPFKWSKIDHALLLIALFYLFGGLLPLLPIDHFLAAAPRHQTTGMWRRSFHSVMFVAGYWILVLAFSLWLQREPPK